MTVMRMVTSQKQFKDEIKRFRIERFWTLERMAAESGVSMPTIYRWEKGRAKPSALRLARIKKHLPEIVPYISGVSA